MPIAQKRKAGQRETPYLHRVFMLLRFLSECSAAGARVGDISERLGVHRVTTHRLLRTLIETGYVEQLPDLSYRLGLEACLLGFLASGPFVPPQITAAMTRISKESEECVFLMRRIGNEGVCIAAHEGSYPIRSMVMRVGARRHLGIGGTSIAILAALPREETERIIRNNSSSYPQYKITADDVRGFVALARRHGYAYSRGIVVSESRTVAVPLSIAADPSMLMSISIVTIESRLAEPRRSNLVKLLKREAEELSVGKNAR